MIPQLRGLLGNGPSAKTRAKRAERDERQRAADYAENIRTGRVRSENFARGSFQAREGESHRPDKRKKKGRKAKEQKNHRRRHTSKRRRGDLPGQPFPMTLLTDIVKKCDDARELFQHV